MTSYLKDKDSSTMAKPYEHDPSFEWPWWATAYAALIGIPMLVLSFGVAGWMVISYIDEIFGELGLGLSLLLVAFVLSFIMAGLLFYYGAQRVFAQQSEALNFSALAHLMVLGPAATLIAVAFAEEEDIFLTELNNALNRQQVSDNMIFIAWIVIHAYFALFLSLSDNTSRFVDTD